MSDKNPYSVTSGRTPTTFSEREQPSWQRTVGFATSFVALLCLVQYMMMDFFVVRLRPYPEEVHRYTWTVLLFPVMPLFCLWFARRTGWLRCSPGVLVLSLFTGLLCSIPLIATCGVWFHFLIGGKL